MRREGLEADRRRRFEPKQNDVSYVEACFGDGVPTVAASDYICAVPDMIQKWMNGKYSTLGTDGYGRSDTREALRQFFEIDPNNIVLASVSVLEANGDLPDGSTTALADEFGLGERKTDVTS